MTKLAVVALGGNALLRSGQKGTYAEQLQNVQDTCNSLLQLVSMNYNLVIGHGNGPQVGNVLLQQDAGRKVFLILDNLGVHHCKPVKAWLKDHHDQMEVFYLPSYSPELNPEERLNADLKHVIGRKVPMRTKAKLRAAAEDHMTVVANEPERVKAYFQDPRVKYAA